MSGMRQIGRLLGNNDLMVKFFRWMITLSILLKVRRLIIEIKKIFIKYNLKKAECMRIHRIRTYDGFIEHTTRNKRMIENHQAFLRRVTPTSQVPFTVLGYSYTAGKQVDFLVDFQHSDKNGQVNWRESVNCPETFFNNRMRATFHLFDLEMESYQDSKIYITEQVTPIYTYFANKFPNTVGSEFLGDKIPFGSVDKNGVRNETLCALTFPDQSFDILISLDVLEHIPDYEQAFKECARVVKDGGRMMWSVPFISDNRINSIRAKIENDEINYILPPEYHGDTLSGDGVLCFQHFGWEMLEQMRSAGFRDAYALTYNSSEFGYLGGEQFMFVAIK